MRALAILVLVSACGSGDPVGQVCTKLGAQCGLNAEDVGDCKKDLSSGVSVDIAKKLAGCTKAANTCPDLISCFATVGVDLDDFAKEVEQEFESGVGNPSRDPECVDFKAPTGDCTSADRSCEWDSDCGDGTRCNKEVDRCFDPKGPCVGTPCTFDSACAKGERCNNRTSTCFRTADSQHCMPCVFDKDCGSTRCVGNTCAK